VRRREFIAGLGGATLFPFASGAQEPDRTYRLGFFIPLPRNAPAVIAFFDELRKGGFIEGRNLVVVPDGFGVGNDSLSEQAAAVVRVQPDAIVSGPELHTRALQRLTRTIPLIGMTEDMVAEGLVASLARPGGNTTGISLLSPELDSKRQDILIEAVPGAHHLAILADNNITRSSHLEALQSAARARGVDSSIFGVIRAEEIPAAIEKIKKLGAQGLNVLASPLFFVHRRVAIERAIAVRLPAIYQWPDMADEGGLLGYGPRFADVYRQRARMVAKILRGTIPAEIPVEQPTQFELAINLKTAKAIGFEIPLALFQRADKVIE
jgi:putative ABC transport system substrate-binding protein